MNNLRSAENIYNAHTHTHTYTHRPPAVYGTQHMTGFSSHTPFLIRKSKISSALPG